MITPWGEWNVLFEGPSYKVKRITVNPGHRLSYQRHLHRREHWMIVEGSGIMTLDGRSYEVASGQTVDIPIGTPHRIAGAGTEPLVFIEIWSGNSCDEEDIIRLEDDYGRTGK
ncbi:MAG: phosphomannose isomerase type II C-terminal cupin domain [Pseudomonadota bacterium]